ncbi:hypothetical protein V6N12_072936 [Hibiscus sabdariffa]|uniref:Uncharacterized protein n=1 Tax=Hibiscus sabdariffa TaxID=183260 RepID=A0ABR2B5A7_9ROSI
MDLVPKTSISLTLQISWPFINGFSIQNQWPTIVAVWILVCIVMVAATVPEVDSNRFNACFKACHRKCKNDGHDKAYCELKCDAD